MKIFAIICLSVILIVIQHLMNWGWRKWFGSKSNNYDNPGGIGIVVMLFGLLISGAILMTLSRWIVEVYYDISLPGQF